MKIEIFNILFKKDIKQIVDYLEKELEKEILGRGIKYGEAEIQVNIETIFHY